MQGADRRRSDASGRVDRSGSGGPAGGHRRIDAVRTSTRIGTCRPPDVAPRREAIAMRSSITRISSGSRVRIGYVVESQLRRRHAVGISSSTCTLRARRTSASSPESFAATPQADVAIDEDPAFGNRLARMHVEPGALAIRYAGTVEVSHYMAEPALLCGTPLAELPTRTLLYSAAEPLLPGRSACTSMAWQEFGGLAPGYAPSGCRLRVGARAHALSAGHVRRQHVGAGNARTSASASAAISPIWRSRYCARSITRRRIVTGVDYGADPGLGPPDFHAYVEVFLERPLVSVRSNRHFAAHWADPHRQPARDAADVLVRHDVRRCPHDDAENLACGGAGPDAGIRCRARPRSQCRPPKCSDSTAVGRHVTTDSVPTRLTGTRVGGESPPDCLSARILGAAIARRGGRMRAEVERAGRGQLQKRRDATTTTRKFVRAGKVEQAARDAAPTSDADAANGRRRGRRQAPREGRGSGVDTPDPDTDDSGRNVRRAGFVTKNTIAPKPSRKP